MQRPVKHVRDSRTEQIQIIMPQHINGYNRLFGGQLVEWIDIVAGVVARRHSNCKVTTVSIDNLHFKAPAYVDNTIVLIGQITFVGMTSMEVCVDTFVEHLNGEKQLVNRAFLTMVALDDRERPTIVPGLELETAQERLDWESGEKRSALRKQRSIEMF